MASQAGRRSRGQRFLDAVLNPLRTLKARVKRAPGDGLEAWGRWRVFNKTRERVASGPFRGIQFVRHHDFGTPVPKVLGTYEKELHPVIDSLSQERLDGVINVGAAEGLYAVGLALRVPSVPVVVFETLDEGRRSIERMARRNGVWDRLLVHGSCTSGSLAKFLDAERRYLLIMDVEGEEVEILDPDIVARLGRSFLVVETHDFRVTNCTASIAERFVSSHDIRIIEAVERRCADFPLKLALPRATKRRLMNERRPMAAGPMKWLVMIPKDRRNAETAPTDPASGSGSPARARE